MIKWKFKFLLQFPTRAHFQRVPFDLVAFVSGKKLRFEAANILQHLKSILKMFLGRT